MACSVRQLGEPGVYKISARTTRSPSGSRQPQSCPKRQRCCCNRDDEHGVLPCPVPHPSKPRPVTFCTALVPAACEQSDLHSHTHTVESVTCGMSLETCHNLAPRSTAAGSQAHSAGRTLGVGLISAGKSGLAAPGNRIPESHVARGQSSGSFGQWRLGHRGTLCGNTCHQCSAVPHRSLAKLGFQDVSTKCRHDGLQTTRQFCLKAFSRTRAGIDSRPLKFSLVVACASVAVRK